MPKKSSKSTLDNLNSGLTSGEAGGPEVQTSPDEPRGEQQNYLKKGMERLSGTQKMVETSIKIKTEEGWKSVQIPRKKIYY